MLLKCSVADPTGGPTQNVLQLAGGEMAIAAELMGDPSDFLLVPVL